jgi:O-antigen ligase
MLAFVSITYSGNIAAGLWSFLDMLSVASLYLFIRIGVDSREVLLRFLILICVGFVLSSTLAYAAKMGWISLEALNQVDLRLERSRFSGFLRNPNRYAYYSLLAFWCALLILLLPLAGRGSKSYLRSIASRWLPKLLLASIALFCALMIVFSLSRGVIIALVVSCIGAVAFAPDHKSRMAGLVVVGSATSLFGIFQALVSTVGARFDFVVMTESGSSTARLALWRYAQAQIESHPFLGVGLGALYETTGDDGFNVHDPHNLYLYVLMYFGAAGFVVLVLAIVGVFRTIIGRQWVHRNTGRLLLVFSACLTIPGFFHTILFWKPFVISLAVVMCFCEPGMLSRPSVRANRHPRLATGAV